MDLKLLSDKNLLENTKQLAGRERETTLQVLHHLREVERRSLFAALAYSSLFEYAVKELRYSAGAAQRRISSMRLLKELPEIEKKVESGELSLSALTQAQVFFRQEKTAVEEKRAVLLSLENKSSREVEKELVSRCSDPQLLVPEKIRSVSSTHTELKVLVDEDFLKELEELRGFLASKCPRGSLKEILSYALSHTLKDLKPKAPKELKVVKIKKVEKDLGLEKRDVALEILKERVNSSAKEDLTSSVKNPTRYIPAQVKREVWRRDGGQCSFVDFINKKRCCSRHGLELDHIHPHSRGGEATTENLRLRCRAHNQLAAVQSFGAQKMAQFIPRMK